MEEKTIICIQCGGPFTLTVSQQQRLRDLGFDQPKRCRQCRDNKMRGGPSRYERKMQHKRRQSQQKREDLYDLRRVRDALIRANRSRDSAKAPAEKNHRENNNHQ